MSTAGPNWVLIGTIFIVLLLAAAGMWVYAERRRRSERLQRHYGPEYGRTVTQLGTRTKGEADLLARERRIKRLNILPLTQIDAARFSQAWNRLQGRFVDSPKDVVVEADRLVSEVMAVRGYPMGNFERSAADVSVDHPQVVANYRAARSIALRHKSGQATTEDLRKAVVHYRALFDDLLEVNAVEQGDTVPNKPQQISVQS